MAFKEEIYNNFVQDFSIILRQKIIDLEISNLIFLCIGTDRIIGDSFGPLVGYKLKYLFRKEKNIKVIGHLENTVSSYNIIKVIDYINNKYKNYFLIAIDAALSNKTELGKIIVSKNALNVGSGFNKNKLYVGNMSIKGIVSKDLKNAKHNFKILQNTPLNLIMTMADCVAQGICDVINV
ncbi:MAG: spore protease YyaC [Clostridia bacterium]|nr:spore protease YyaC [Clostridia bacterium]